MVVEDNAGYRNSCSTEDAPAPEVAAWLFKTLMEEMCCLLQIPVLKKPAIFYNSVKRAKTELIRDVPVT